MFLARPTAPRASLEQPKHTMRHFKLISYQDARALLVNETFAFGQRDPIDKRLKESIHIQHAHGLAMNAQLRPRDRLHLHNLAINK